MKGSAIMIKHVLLILVISISFSQALIETKEYKFYKSKDAKDVNIMELINEKEGVFKVELITVDNIKYERIKKLLVLPCELEVSLLSELSSNAIEYKICKSQILSTNYLLIDKNSPTITIAEDKFKYVEGNFIFYISGEYSQKKSSASILNNGILREWHENGELYLEYNMKNGIKNGACKKWYDNGKMEILYYYSTGKLHGNQKKWYSNGIKRGEWNYQNDNLHGISKEWKIDGKIKFTKIYDNGILISEEGSS